MATLVQNAIRVKQTFDDIYDAIVEAGVTPSGGVDTYAEAIGEIEEGGEITPEYYELNTVSYGQDVSSIERMDTNYYLYNDGIENAYFLYPSNTQWKCKQSGKYGLIYGFDTYAEYTNIGNYQLEISLLRNGVVTIIDTLTGYYGNVAYTYVKPPVFSTYELEKDDIIQVYVKRTVLGTYTFVCSSYILFISLED